MVYAKDNGAGTYLNVHSGLSIYGKDIYADENDAERAMALLIENGLHEETEGEHINKKDYDECDYKKNNPIPENKKISNKSWQQYIGMALFVLMGGVCGICIAGYADSYFGDDISVSKMAGFFIVMLAVMYVAIFIHIILHELGHLIGGLISGYEFCSFRIMSFMWKKENGKIRLRRMNLAGTGGQCLMSPPDMINGKIPVFIYNLGGAIMNLVVSVIFIIMFFVSKEMPYVPVAMFISVGEDSHFYKWRVKKQTSLSGSTISD